MGAAHSLTAPDRLTAADLACVVRAYRDALVTHRAALNRLNVYPVPDGDTGTNMALTLEAVQKEIDAARRPARHGELGALPQPWLAHGRPRQLGRHPVPGPARPGQRVRPGGDHRAGRGGRGVLPGQRQRLRRRQQPGGRHHPHGRQGRRPGGRTGSGKRGRRRRAGLAAPRPGRSARGRPRGAPPGRSTGPPQQLPALRAAGVVDAGGAGLLLLFDSFLHVVAGREIEAPPATGRGGG